MFLGNLISRKLLTFKSKPGTIPKYPNITWTKKNLDSSLLSDLKRNFKISGRSMKSAKRFLRLLKKKNVMYEYDVGFPKFLWI